MNDPMFQPLTSEWAPEAKIPGSPIQLLGGIFFISKLLLERKKS